MPVSLADEIREQQRWRPLPGWVNQPIFESFLKNEFRKPVDLAAMADQYVRQLAAYANSRVPYYRDLFASLNLKPDDMDSAAKLRLLPILTKADVQAASQRLRSTMLPAGEKIAIVLKSSGTTGEPVAIAHTMRSRLMMALLKQREMRWARFDPDGTMAYIRAGTDLPMAPDGNYLQKGDTLRLPGWAYLRNIFHTGPFLGYLDSNGIDEQIDWLLKEKPDYLLCNAAHLEHLALALQEAHTTPVLKALTAVSQQLTPEMKHSVERSFSAPVQQNYGLNEIGIVASRCAEGGRYHIHPEHCVVEIVDEEGNPCRPGEQGKLLVTALSNLAMPLIRYDVDDMAIVADGPCPCGRTLPAFAEIIGRYRRTALLPPGTWDYWVALLTVLHYELPAEKIACVRKYQLHQYRDRSFELRMVTSDANLDQLIRDLQEGWHRLMGVDAYPLSVRRVDDIPRPASGKFQNFTSDFVPQMTVAAPRPG